MSVSFLSVTTREVKVSQLEDTLFLYLIHNFRPYLGFSEAFTVDSARQVISGVLGAQEVGRIPESTADSKFVDSTDIIVCNPPDDPYFNPASPLVNWSMQPRDSSTGAGGIGSCKAWAYMDVSPTNGVVIGVLDVNGVAVDHPDLSGKWDGLGEPDVDSNGAHGTTVAGIAAAVHDNTIGVAGVGIDAKIRPYNRDVRYELKYTDLGRAVDSPWVDVIVLTEHQSGIPEWDWLTIQAWQAPLKRARERLIPVVVSCGNNGLAWESVPSIWDSLCISVGSQDSTGFKSSFSSWGCDTCPPFPDLLAPGRDVASIGFNPTPGPGNWTYGVGNADGTSWSAPMVAGVCALAKAYDPTFTPMQIENLLESTAYKHSWHQDSAFKYGAGLLDAFAFMTEVVNYAEPAEPTTSGDVACLIITDSSLSGAFQSLADRRSGTGAKTEIVTVEHISSAYSPADTSLSAKIRSCISDYYDNSALEYVILGGDGSVVPFRYAFNDLRGAGQSFISDHYYACLDGDWNNDGDSLYGEVEDSVDLVPEVAVGRLPFSTVAEVNSFMGKLSSYESVGVNSWRNNVLSLASRSFQEGDGPRINQFLLNHLGSMTATELYDGNDGTASLSTYFAAMNSGQGLVIKHGNAQHDGNYRLRHKWDYLHYSDVDTLSNNAMPSVVWSSSCWNHRLDSDTCMARRYMSHATGGAVAFIGTTFNEYGFCGIPMADEFFSSLMDEGSKEIGKLLNLGQQAVIPEANHNGGYRHTVMSYALSGDPLMILRTKDPDAIYRYHQDTVQSGVQITVVDTIRWHPVKPGIEGLPVCLMKGDEVYRVDTTGDSGAVSFEVTFRSGGIATIGTPGNDTYPLDIETIVVLPCCNTRGDIDHSGSDADIGDVIYLVSLMFQDGPDVPCWAEADVNGDSSSRPDIADLIYLVTYMFQDGNPPPPCP